MPAGCPSLVLALAILAAPLSGQSPRRVTRLADGVYAIEHRDAGDGFAGGNTMVVIGARQVLVVDPPFLPSDAKEDIGQIRTWTDKPVAFVVNSHFHNDHNLGNRAYMEAFPAVTIIAQTETRKEMDRFGPGSESRELKGNRAMESMLATGKTASGHVLTAEERAEVQQALSIRAPGMAQLHGLEFQSATLTFTDGLTVDLGGREVEVRFLGRGNTAGDAVVFLPREGILAAGDLVVYPIPYVYDGYPSEWPYTLRQLAGLEPKTIVPGHGPVLHDLTYVVLLRDLMESTVRQLNAELARIGPAMFHTVDEVKGAIDLTPFRQRFAGSECERAAAFDDMASRLIQLAFKEASLR